MKFTKVIIRFEAENLYLAEELICDIFFSFNFKGVVCDVPLNESGGYEQDVGFGALALPEPEFNSISGFLPLVDSCTDIVAQIRGKTVKLVEYGISVEIKTEIVDEKEWSDAWKEYFEVTRITERITIKPEWRDHDEKKDEIVIHLDPGMAFGTGTHPSTFMCIKLIEKYLEPGDQFLDIGTGSGILMIAAAKLGANRVTGIDNDEIAIEVAQKNLDKNSIDPEIFSLLHTTLEKTEKRKYELIAVNIIAQIIVDIMPEISERMTGGGTAILSGIITERHADVVRAADACGLFVVHEESIDEWVSLVIKSRGR